MKEEKRENKEEWNDNSKIKRDNDVQTGKEHKMIREDWKKVVGGKKKNK